MSTKARGKFVYSIIFNIPGIAKGVFIIRTEATKSGRPKLEDVYVVKCHITAGLDGIEQAHTFLRGVAWVCIGEPYIKCRSLQDAKVKFLVYLL